MKDWIWNCRTLQSLRIVADLFPTFLYIVFRTKLACVVLTKRFDADFFINIQKINKILKNIQIPTEFRKLLKPVIQ